MKKIRPQSYQLRKNMRWAPGGVVIEFGQGKAYITEIDLRKVSCLFDTKEEADNFFVNYLQK